MYELSSSDSAGLRHSTNYSVFKDALLEFDSQRFRGLGEQRTSCFIQHAIATCDSIDLIHFEGVLTVMKAMCFLGCNMLNDPRVASVTAPLHGSTEHGDTRRQEFHTAAVDFLKTYAGAQLEHFSAALSILGEYCEEVSRTPLRDHKADRQMLVRELPTPMRHALQSWREPLLSATNNAVQALSVDCDIGQTFCFAACALLGTGFYRDPLYPWVTEVADRASACSPEARMAVLLPYAAKRIRKQVTVLEKCHDL